MDLNFQSFSNDFSTNSTNAQSGFTGGNMGERDRNTLVDDNVSTTGSTKSMFSMSYYQQYFDVDTEQVVKRILNSVVPTNNNFILDFVQPLPDLWGPFWISVTLVFSIGIFGNIAQYIGNDGSEGNYGSDFRLVTTASTLIFLYVVFVPMILFAILWHRKSDLQYPYFDIVCAYGYSLTIFIPVSLLWMLNVNWFRWALIFTSVALSGSVLAKAIYPAFKNDSNRLVALGSVLIVFLLHFLLAFAFKEMFFDAVHPLKPDAVVAPSAAASQVQTIGNHSSLVANGTLPTLPAVVSTTVHPSSAARSESNTVTTAAAVLLFNTTATSALNATTTTTTTVAPVNVTSPTLPATTIKTSDAAASVTTTSATTTNTTVKKP